MIISFLVFVFALFLVLEPISGPHSTDKKRARLQKRLRRAAAFQSH